MDALSIVIIVAVIAGLLYLTVGKKDDKSSGSTTTGGGAVKDDTPAVKVKKAPAKKAPANKSKSVANTKKAKLPGDTQLQKNTKGQLEELGRKHGIELDKRLTKAKMITELKKQFKTAHK